MSSLTAENINQIVASQKSFALVKLPNENAFRVKAGEWIRTKLEDVKEDCFFVQPFDANELGYALVGINSGFRPVRQAQGPQAQPPMTGEITIPTITDQTIYDETFEKFINEINVSTELNNRNPIKKMILSKVKKGSDEKINIGESFFLLCENYPKASVNLFFIPNLGLWMGASPELLLRADDSKIESMSLAGTLPPGKKVFDAKEKEEQKIVTNFISVIFSKYDSQPIIQKQEIVSAGNVSHLCNYFVLHKKYDQQLVNKMVIELHPTPAVGGFPKKEAVDFILQTEKHQRELYAGFFGFIEPDKRTELFVNIRCMKIVEGIPYIFTGGGITKESNVLAEWNETEIKAQGLINSLSIGEN